jgi:hypothetical protein
MDDQELDRLEQDLDAVAGRLQGGMDWKQLEPRVRWALGRPMRDLLSTLGLIAVFAGLGFWTPVGWMLALGTLLAALPGRVQDVRERRRALEGVGEGDLLALIQHELMLRMTRHLTLALFHVLLAILFSLVGVFLASDSRPGLAAAAVLVVIALVRLFWFFPRASRALTAFERGQRTA